MKTTRKITAIGLALLMIIVCGASVFAEENQFTSNEAVPGGGAIVYDPKTAPADTNFTDGKAAPGGAIYFNPEGGSVNVNFTDNKAAPGGGAIYHPGK